MTLLFLLALAATQVTPAANTSTTLGKPSLGFVENAGQWSPEASFLLRGVGQDLWISPGEARLDLYDPRAPAGGGQVIGLSFVGAKGTFRPGRKLAHRISWIEGSEGTPLRYQSAAFSTVANDNAYRGIDILWMLTAEGPRFDLIVKPGADPSQIALRVSGQFGDLENVGESVRFNTRYGTATLGKLVASQVGNTGSKNIACKFVKIAPHTIGLSLGNYDRSKPLLIDPTIFATYFGAGRGDAINDIDPGSDGSLLFAGSSRSTDFPATEGAYDDDPKAARNGRSAAIVGRLSADGSQLAFATFIQTRYGDSSAKRVRTLPDGRIVVAGETSGDLFPTTWGAVRRRYVGTGSDCFVSILESDGSELLSSSLLGGSYDDRLSGLCIHQGWAGPQIVLAGTTASFGSAPEPFPIKYASDTTAAGSVEGFLTGLSINLKQINFSTFIGGSGAEEVTDLEASATGFLAVTGRAATSDFGMPLWGWGGKTDGFVALFYGGGSFLNGYFVGGAEDDILNSVAFDQTGTNMYVAGSSLSTTISDMGAGRFTKTKALREEAFTVLFDISDYWAYPLAYTFLRGSPTPPSDGYSDSFAVGVGVDPAGYPIYAVHGIWHLNNFIGGEHQLTGTLMRLEPDLRQRDVSEVLYSYRLSLITSTTPKFSAFAMDKWGTCYTTGMTMFPIFNPTPNAFDGVPPTNNAVAFLTRNSFSKLESIVVQPSALVGGGMATATVSLSAPAPAEGALVRLRTSSSKATFPESVMISPGQESLSFQVPTAQVASPTKVSVTGTLGFDQVEGRFLIDIPRVLSVKVDPKVVVGGSSASLTVQLTAPAPEWGAVVALSATPAGLIGFTDLAISFEPGSSSKTVTISTVPVISLQTATITGASGAKKSSADLMIKAPSLQSLTLSQASVVGGTGTTLKAKLSGPAPSGFKLSLTDPDDTRGLVTLPAQLTFGSGAMEASCTVTTTPVLTKYGDTFVTLAATDGARSSSVPLRVRVARIISVSVLPGSVIGGVGTDVALKVTLDGTAPPGGIRATVVQNPVGKTTLGTSLLIPGGASDATLRGTAAQTSTDVAVSATAGYTIAVSERSELATSFLVLRRPSIESVSLDPSTIVGGNEVRLTIQLTSPAPTGGLPVSITSDSPLVTFPGTAVIPAGATALSATGATIATAQNSSAEISVAVRLPNGQELRASVTLQITSGEEVSR